MNDSAFQSIGGPGGTRTLISWVRTRNPAIERRAHFGEDNGTRTRTAALTTRRLPLRLCPPQSGPQLPTPGLVGSRGFEPRSARSERAASSNCATSRMMVPPGGLEPPPLGLRARHACIHTTEGNDWFGLPIGWAEQTYVIRLSKNPLTSELVGGQRTIRSYHPCFGDSARTRTWIRELWRLGCFRCTTLPISSQSKTESSRDRAQLGFLSVRPIKKAF